MDRVSDLLARAGGRRLVQRLPALAESGRALPTDPAEVGELLTDPGFCGGLGELAERLRRDQDRVRAEAATYLRQMSATHTERSGELWQQFGQWMLRGYDQLIDEEGLGRLRQLDRKHSLVFLISHRSYLDGWTMGPGLASLGISPCFFLGGSNLDLFPINTLARNSGVVYIRRATEDLPVYRFTLRAYIAQLVRNRRNLWWSIEGGRTRTGKLRPPRYGLLRYVIDAVESFGGPEVLLVPVSNVYDQLHEVGLVTAEARGGAKRSESPWWFFQYSRQLSRRLGRVYVDFGEPLRLRDRLAELESEEKPGVGGVPRKDSGVGGVPRKDSGVGGVPRRESGHVVERVALDVSHRLNRATPVTPTAAVCVAMLAADRALSLQEVLATVAPLADYLGRRGWPVAGAASLTDAMTIRRALQDLVASGVLTCYSAGDETVWGVGPEQHLNAAFYRNGAIHFLVPRAIAELALLSVAQGGSTAEGAWEHAFRLRDLLKFDFFFAGRDEFRAEVEAELGLIDPQASLDAEPQAARRFLQRAPLPVAHLVLRPYLEAYWLVAVLLAAADEGDEFDEPRFLADCLRVGRQWALQRRLASEESVSLEMFRPALMLARHRGLLSSDDPLLAKHRAEFADELEAVVAAMGGIAEISRDR